MSEKLLRSLIKEFLEESELIEAEDSKDDGEEVGRPRKHGKSAAAKAMDDVDTAVLAKRTGRSRSHLDKIRRGDAVPSFKTALAIQAATGGEVPLNAFVSSVKKS